MVKQILAETTFTLFTQNQKWLETTDNFEVSAGNSGTFDVPYTIRGGTL